jgi:hypothetical protein
VVPDLETSGEGSLPCHEIITGSAFLFVRDRREIMDLWAHLASLGLLVNLAIQAPRGPQVPHLQVRAILLHLTYRVPLPASLPRKGTRRCHQSSALCSQLETARGTLINFHFSTVWLIQLLHKRHKCHSGFALAFWRTNRGKPKRKKITFVMSFVLSMKKGHISATNILF